MGTKVTTFGIDLIEWKDFQKKMIDASEKLSPPSGGGTISSLVKGFLKGDIEVDLFVDEKEAKELYTAGLHIEEKVWLDLDTYLSKEKKKYIGDKDKQKRLNKGNVIVKLIRHYVND